MKPCGGLTLSSLWVSSHKRTSDFYLSSWQRGESPVPLLLVRLLLTAASVATLAWSVVEAPTRFWLLYLTNWGLVLLVAMTLSALLVSVMAHCTRIAETSLLPWYMSMYWLFFNITVTIAIAITILYWSLIFDTEAETSPRALGLDVSTHALNTFFALVELFVSRTPVKPVHVYQPLGVGLWYAAFTVIYFFAGGTDGNGLPYIYEVLDWNNGSRTGTVVGATAGGIIVIYILLWGIFHLRNRLSSMLVRTTSRDLPLAPPMTPTIA